MTVDMTNTNIWSMVVLDSSAAPYTIHLNQKDSPLSFGRSPSNDIVLSSSIVSSEHGRFIFKNGSWVIEDKEVYGDRPSTNGLIYNNANVASHVISDGDFIRIDDGVETISEGVLFVFSKPESENKWNTIPSPQNKSITIGRDKDCDICLPHVNVSNHHAIIKKEANKFYIIDNGSTNGIIVNNSRVAGKQQLHEKDVITIANTKIIFTSTTISYCSYESGISVDTSDVVVVRDKGKKAKITCDHVSLNIKPGELVSIIGGSGAGKSTVLNCMCGYLKPNKGEVYINGVDLYKNFDSLKKQIGYVPQQDIVYDNLTLIDMLTYAAKLRLPSDISVEERNNAVERAISTVKLTEFTNSTIKRMSGGQKKRASIAVELLSDPDLLFLDEPASGLDPGTERELMNSLREMANGGKTVILVTHSTLQLEMCDKIIFMGKGGKLCFCGTYQEALDFFGISNIVDVYDKLDNKSEEYKNKYSETRPKVRNKRETEVSSLKAKSHGLRQLPVLCARYLKLVANDRQRLILILLQAPLLAALISLVADGNQFEQYEMTKSLLFALSCSAFWVGMLNAIQEICKERTVLKREYMTGLSLGSYITSKILVLGCLCLIQSLMITGVFLLTVGLPEKGIITYPFVEILLTTFITAVSSTAMGLFVSSLFTNADRAMTVAPILLMPQILFSGLIFKLSGATDIISWFAICRWSMEAYGTTADLNQLPLRLQQEGILIPHELEDFFTFSVEHILTDWGILAAFAVAFLILSRLVLVRIGRGK